GIAIDTGHTGVRQQRLHLRLDALGAIAELLEERTRAFPAGLRQRHRVVAVVAARAADPLVDGQRDAAVRTLEGVAALAAEDGRREASPVQEQDRLLAALDAGSERLPQRRAEDDLGTLLREHLAHI